MNPSPSINIPKVSGSGTGVVTGVAIVATVKLAFPAV